MKRLLSIFLLLTLFLSSISVNVFATNAEGEYVSPDKFIYGDVNQDGEVTVKDVTYIQKGLAEIHYVNAVQRFLADPDNEGFSIKNATAIQKYLAQYETKTPWGEEILMASQDEFSNAVGDVGTYDVGIISVRPLPEYELSYEYTLEDFPEYKFSRIEKYVLNYNKMTYYHLYLKEPSKENVLEAINALEYRAYVDLKSVNLVYYMPAS